MRNRHFWRQDGGYRQWIEFFFGQQLPEPHSTKQYEDTVGWALETDAEAMIAEREGRAAPPAGEAEALCRRMRCPVRVLHGSDDRCQPVSRGRRLAELSGGELVVLDGAGHLPHGRDPVKVTRLITEFADQITGGFAYATTCDPGPVPPEAGPVPVLPHRAAPPRARDRPTRGYGTGPSSSETTRTSCRTPSAGTCRPSGTGPRGISPTPATSPASPYPLAKKAVPELRLIAELI